MLRLHGLEGLGFRVQGIGDIGQATGAYSCVHIERIGYVCIQINR